MSLLLVQTEHYGVALAGPEEALDSDPGEIGLGQKKDVSPFYFSGYK